MLPVSGSSSPAMMRKIVVFPLPEAPSRTSDSPSAMSKLMSSSTTAFLNFLLTERTLAAAVVSVRSPRFSAPPFVSLPKMVVISSGRISALTSFSVQPVAREEKYAEDEKRQEREHDGDRVRCLDLPFVKFREDVERRGLCAHRQIS